MDIEEYAPTAVAYQQSMRDRARPLYLIIMGKPYRDQELLFPIGLLIPEREQGNKTHCSSGWHQSSSVEQQ